MTVEKLVTLEQFQKDPKLQEQFGDYSAYLKNCYKDIYKTDVFTLGTLSNPYALNMGYTANDKRMSIFGVNREVPTDIQQDKRFEEISKNLEKIDPKYRPLIETELKSGNIYRASLYMQIALDKSKLKDEFANRSKAADAEAAANEEAYYAAVKAEHEAEKAQKAAERYLEEMIASYDEGDYHIADAQKKLKDLITGMFDATLAREIAADRWMMSEKASLNAYYNTAIADAMLK